MQDKCTVVLRNRFNIITTMIVQNTTFTANFVPIEKFDGWSFSLGDVQKKFCWTAYQGTVQGKCRVILRNGIDIITTKIVQNTTFTTNFVPIERFDDWKYPLGDKQKKIC